MVTTKTHKFKHVFLAQLPVYTVQTHQQNAHIAHWESSCSTKSVLTRALSTSNTSRTQSPEIATYATAIASHVKTRQQLALRVMSLHCYFYKTANVFLNV